MTKVLIVDDEVLVRVGIKSSIAWQEYGFELVGEASNGIDALEIIREQNPDILITDIKMPKMDDIELLKELEKAGSPIQSVVLSFYNEFEYVREAMKHGAKDYILKLSMEPKELLEILLKIKENLMMNSQKPVSVGQELSVNLEELKNQFFHKLLNEVP